MNRTYSAGMDVSQKNGRPHTTIAIFNKKTRRFLIVTKRNWVARMWLFVCRVAGVGVMKETNP